MRLTIKSKLVIAIAIIISLAISIGLIGIYFIIDNSEEEYIYEDMRIISDFSKNYIYSNSVLGDSNSNFKVVNTINELFNVYVSIEVENDSASTGKILINDNIEEFKLEEDKSTANLRFYGEGDLWVGTLYYPIHIEEAYYGDLIIQKDYSQIHKLNQSILIGIAITLLVMAIVLILLVFVIVKNTTKPLEKLTDAIKAFGKGKSIESLEATTKDEIGDLIVEFNSMKHNILLLQQTSREFFSNATHELKTPLTVIKGYTQLLQEEEFKDTDVVEMLDNIEDENVKMNNLVKKLLTVSKCEAKLSTEKEYINIKVIIKDILNTFRVVIDEKEYNINLNLEDVSINAVKEDVIILISNLIDNSLKYSEGKHISIELTRDREFLISNECGEIKADIKDKLLEPFIKGNSGKNINSTGLGLYICSEISINNGFSLSYSIKEKEIEFILKL